MDRQFFSVSGLFLDPYVSISSFMFMMRDCQSETFEYHPWFWRKLSQYPGLNWTWFFRRLHDWAWLFLRIAWLEHGFFWEVRDCMTWAWLFGMLHDWAWLFLGSERLHDLGTAFFFSKDCMARHSFIWRLKGCVTWALLFFLLFFWGLHSLIWLYREIERLRDLGTAFFWGLHARHGFI